MKTKRLLFACVAVGPCVAVAQNRIGCLFANNDETGNTIEQFIAFDDGSLMFQGRTSTGGDGATGGNFSSERLAVTSDQRCLVATNPLSNNISVFSVDASTCGLTAVGPPVPTGQTAGINGMGVHIVPRDTTSDGTGGQLMYITHPNSNVIVGYNIFADCQVTALGLTPEPEQTTNTADFGNFKCAFSQKRAVDSHPDEHVLVAYDIGPTGELWGVPGCSPCPPTRGMGRISGLESSADGNLLFGGEIFFGQTTVAVFNNTCDVPTETAGSPFVFPSGSNSNVLKLADGCLVVTNQHSNTLTRLRVGAGGDLSLAGDPSDLPSAMFPTGIVFGCRNSAGNYPLWNSQWYPSQIVASQLNSATCGLVSSPVTYPSGSSGPHLLNGLAFVSADSSSCVLPSKDVPLP